MADLWPHGLPADSIADLGQTIAQRYQRIADRIHQKIRTLTNRGWTDEALDQWHVRLQLAQELEESVRKAIATVPPERLAQMVVSESAAGAAASISRIFADVPSLQGYSGIDGSSVTSAGLQAVTAIELDLRNTFTQLNSRILRDSQDVFQQITAEFASIVTAGVETRRALRKEILNRYLSQGVGSYVDTAGRHWPIDVYSEMATRTAASRAWREQSVVSMESHGVELFSPVAGRTSCEICGKWQGRVVSRSHPGGSVVQVKHATSGAVVSVSVDASLDEMRSDGWGHPNCRCVLIPHIPGSGIEPTDFTTRDPEAEADRAEERRLRRELRAARDRGDSSRAAEIRRDLREVRTRIDKRKTNYATRIRRRTTPEWKPTMTRAQADEWSRGSVFQQEFLHGTTREAASNIRSNGFHIEDNRFGRHQGNGVYLTENEGTSLMYDRGETLITRVNITNPIGIDEIWTDPRFLAVMDEFEETADALTEYANRFGFDAITKYDMLGKLDELLVLDPRKVVVIRT